MNKLFYEKLAFNNIKKNSKTYFPYIITCISTIIMFYIMHGISINEGLDRMSGAESLKLILSLGTIVIGIFSTIFLIYTNSFLMKRRKKEIGLYNVLGLEKRHIRKILFFENLFVAVTSLLLGLIGGIILNKLMFLLLLKLLHFSVPFGFSISIKSIGITIVVFASIFLVTLILNLIQIQRVKPIELLKGGQYGEKEPKTKWIMTIVGIIALGSGYWIALSVESPLSALSLFFVAVILVMIGTYGLFTAGSIALLKGLRKNKKFYYKTNNFISVSSMMYRMKQNAVGLANICILSTAILVMLSSTVSLYVGMEDVLRKRYPRDILMHFENISEENLSEINQIVADEIQDKNIQTTNMANYWKSGFISEKGKGKFVAIDTNSYGSDFCLFMAISISDYNRIEEKDIVLNNDEIILYSSQGDYGQESIVIGDKTYYVKEDVDTFSFESLELQGIMDTYIVIINDIDTICESEDKIYMLGFDVEGTDEDIIQLSNSLKQRLHEMNIEMMIEDVGNSKESFFSIYGGLFFLGIFLGVLFLMATVLIIYYKQISEGYDDKERFRILQNVGMSKMEIKKTIRKQIVMVFFLPLIFAVVHISVAFPIITKLLAILNLTNQPLFLAAMVVTILIFALIYTLIFSVTARTYYKIVE